MSMVKVIYVDQSAGKIKDSRLDDLIAAGKIAAFCGPHGWISVTGESLSDGEMELGNTKERGREIETTGN